MSVVATCFVMLSPASAPKCYNASDPELNSTAWFAENIGLFITYLTLEDLNTFGSAQVSAALAANMGRQHKQQHHRCPRQRVQVYLRSDHHGTRQRSVGFLQHSEHCDWLEPGQAMAIIQSLMLSGALKAASAARNSSRVPGCHIHNIHADRPTILIQTFVTQLITVNPNPDSILQNVPDSMSTEIPRSLLQGFSQSSVVVEKLNQKTWRHEQAVLFFDTVALGIDNSDNMSSSVLQGFTCTRVASMTTTKIKKLVKACRRKGKNRVALRETQLTCMYNYIKEESNVTSYNLYPPDMLLYYDYSKVPRDTCKDYFSELGDADFLVFSDALSFKRTALVNNVKTCLGISGTVLSSDNLQVLGNMVCVLDGSYIQNSDQLILQKLQNCNDLTDEQVAAIETLLMSGKTQYG
ncbi:uncharacterized protein LOC135566841, partial [Oncorhynchus nerka]|uniref:uncharacterized protein LOC135566841 n=1 Tax=Oncorhynchus nerka TaxID=8023 RepID=UPI0031B8628E